MTPGGINDPNVAKQRYQAAVDRMKARGWHVQLYTTLPLIAAIKEQVLAAPVPAVFDHFGGADAALGVEQPGFSDLVDLVKSGKAYVKISGAYRASKQAPDYPDVVPLAKMLIAAEHPVRLAEEKMQLRVRPLREHVGPREQIGGRREVAKCVRRAQRRRIADR